LGFTFQEITGEIQVGLSATKPNKDWGWLNPTWEMKTGLEENRILALEFYTRCQEQKTHHQEMHNWGFVRKPEMPISCQSCLFKTKLKGTKN
jgi:hypothetical protein